MAKSVLVKVFEGNGDFAALHAAEAFLHSVGASVGQNQRGAPTGILFGDYLISKWRGMSAAERAALHGQIDEGDHRFGPIRVRIFDSAPTEFIAAASKAAA